MLAWIAGETTKLDQWRTFDATGDPRDEPYFILGKACGMPDETARHGKFVDLAFGYMGGIAAYAGTTYEGDPSTDAEREQFKATWRQLHPRTMAFWYAVDGAAIEAVRTPGKVQSGHGLRFQCADDFLKLKLPSGRIVRYPFPRIGKSKFGKPCVIFKDTALGKWSDCHYGLGAYGGLWTENIVQAIARDLMAAAMMRLEAAGYACVLTVHDEIIAEVPDGAGSLDEFHRLLVAAVAWAEGLPIAAKVREGQRYSRPAAVGDASAISPISVDDAASVETDADDITLATSDDAGDAVDDAATSIQGSDADDEAPPWVATDMPEPDGTAEAPPESPGEDGPDISLVDLPSAEHVVLVDGSTYIHRAYHVAHREAAPLFRRMLQKTLRELGAGASAPTHLAVIFDAPGPTFRNDIYPEYKANRPPVPEELSSQLPRMREVVRALGLPCIEQAGVEADDVIATYTRQASGAVTIVASDKDLMQLVTDRVTMYEPMKERRIGIAEVTEKFGVPPERVADVQALAGDATDNVPGVPGIGVKTAAQLIRTYGDLETLLGRAGEIGQPKVRQALIENAEQARLSLQLVLLDDTVALDVPLDAIAVTLDALDTRQAADPVATPDADTPEPARAEGLAEPTGNDANADDDPGDVYPGDSDGPTGTGHGERDTGRQVAFYVYKHADGSPYLGVKRTSTKQFPQYHLNGAKWEKGAPAGLRIPYRLPELIKAKRDRWVLICAGEKDANSAAALGFVATCNPEGEKKGAWVPELNTWFAGRPRVAIMEDNDKTGQAHAIEVANALRGIVPEIRIVGFRELPEHGDLTDWIEQGHGAKDLRAWIEAARPFYSKPRMAPIGEWDGKPVPRPEYTVPDRIPARQVFLFSGEGGEGKSIMLQQLCAAHSLGATWLGCTVRQGPAIYLECEDAEEILHWRLAAIAEHYGASFKDLAAAGLRMCSMIEHDSILAATGRNGIVEPTAAYDWLYELAGDTKPVLIGIASTSNTFAGNENNRSEVQQFAKLLTRIALVTGGSVALVTHPSMTGVTSNVASHEGLSGTTQWHNAVRARAVMKKVKVNGEDESDVAENRVREIKFHKNQYGPPVASSFVRWQHGMFLPVDGVHSMGAVERAAKADRVFIALLRRWTEQNRTVSAKVNPSNYAPTAFARQPEATGLTARDFTAAMERLLRDKLIENRMSVSSSGKRSRGHLAVVEGGAHA